MVERVKLATSTEKGTGPRQGHRHPVRQGSKSAPQGWVPSEVNTNAFKVICLHVAQALSHARRGTPTHPETAAEKVFVARFRETYSTEEREAALESTLNFFVGGALKGVLDSCKRSRRKREERSGVRLWRGRL